MKESLFNICLLVMTVPVWVALLYYRIRGHPGKWLQLFAVSVPVGLLLASALWFFVGRPIRSQSTRLFDTPMSEIQSIQINPSTVFSLVGQPLNITNKIQIVKIVKAIRLANEYSPVHPSTHWQCDIVIVNTCGDSYVKAVNTLKQGTILYCKTSQRGFIFTTLQSDTIGGILEEATGEKGKK